MAKLTDAEVLHIAKLAKLPLTSKEIKKFGGQLAKIIDYIGHLKEVDVGNLEPTAQVTGLTNIYRQDKVEVARVLTQDAATSGTENLHNGYFKVKAILTGRSDT